jgi:hypothetical protein
MAIPDDLENKRKKLVQRFAELADEQAQLTRDSDSLHPDWVGQQRNRITAEQVRVRNELVLIFEVELEAELEAAAIVAGGSN